MLKIFFIMKNTETCESMVWKLLENLWNPIQNQVLKRTVLYSSFKGFLPGGDQTRKGGGTPPLRIQTGILMICLSPDQTETDLWVLPLSPN